MAGIAGIEVEATEPAQTKKRGRWHDAKRPNTIAIRPETVPHGAETAAAKPFKYTVHSIDRTQVKTGNWTAAGIYEQPNVYRQKHVVVGDGCEKAENHPNPSLKPCVRNLAARYRNCSFETVKIHSIHSTQVKTGNWTVAGIYKQPNLHRQKHEVVGNGCEKAEHHLNPSQKQCVRNRAAQCRNRSFETVKIHSTRQV